MGFVSIEAKLWLRLEEVPILINGRWIIQMEIAHDDAPSGSMCDYSNAG